MSKGVIKRTLELKRGIAIKRIDECLSAALEAQDNISRLPVFLSRYSRLESYCTSFEAHHLKLCSEILDASALDEEDSVRQQVDDKYFQIIEIHSSITSGSCNSQSEFESNRTDLSVKLPRLNLLNFNGDINTWSTFYDMYNTMVHQNRKLSNIERFSILISLLSGEPLQLIKGFPLSDHNYMDAYAALIDRYQCRRKLAFRYWEELQKVTLKSNSPREMRHLVDTFKENLAVLKNLKLPVSDWNFPLFYLLINKLDVDTRRRFELQNDTKDIPSFDSLLEYLNKAGQALELAEPEPTRAPRAAAAGAASHASPAPQHSRGAPASTAQPRSYTAQSISRTGAYAPRYQAPTKSFVVNSQPQAVDTCIICKANHALWNCPTYRNKTPRDRHAFIKENHCCINCLRQGHNLKSCKSNGRCFKCNSSHHTTLHFEDVASPTTLIALDVTSSAEQLPNTSPSSHSSQLVHSQPTVSLVAGAERAAHISLLATASVEVLDHFGTYRKIRIVIDSGSQSNFITKKCAHRLGLTLKKTNMSIEGIGQSSSVATDSTVYRMRCGDLHPDVEIDALVIPNICSKMPTDKIDITQWLQHRDLHLADPDFNKPAHIDALVGVDVFCQIFLGERHDYGPDGPVLFNTKLGWVVMGKIPCAHNLSKSSSLVCSLDSLDLQVRKFWEIDELPKSSPLSEDDILCERIFDTTHTRTVDGRYVVRLPFKSPEPDFGDSRPSALRRLFALEKRLSRDPQLREGYNNFMKDYLSLGHMDVADHSGSGHSYYIPHHCVLKPSSTSSPLRVVFDASARSEVNSISLNDQLLVGPRLQSDIGSILLRFRLHSIVFTADIRQMYRQILVADKDRDYQRILFRFSPDEPVQEFRLNTVTYGMSSSSFLALRTILQVARDEGEHLPLATAALTQDVYIDDVVTGSHSLASARELMNQITDILHKGCFELRKWASNCSSLLEDTPPEHCQSSSLSFDPESCHSVKVLGLEWNPVADGFSFTVRSIHEKCTKRSVLSELARIFDPVGFLTPLTFAFKCIVQKLWSLGLDWDDPAPHNIAESWSRFRTEFSSLASLIIPRFVPGLNSTTLQIHGFCDSSELGYAAVVYFRCEHGDGQVTTHLIIARSKVAPLKKISIPRLELCAAVLLADLIAHVKDVFNNHLAFDDIFCWSDSTVTLAWLKSPSSRWKTYVSNRVSHIQDKVPPRHWHHVRSQSNPADCATRGLTTPELIDHPLWWQGPPWLSKDANEWPIPSPLAVVKEPPESILEQRNTQTSLFVTVDKFEDFLDRHSSLNKAQRIVGYVLRFIHNCRDRSNRRSGHLVASELKQSLHTIVKIAQISSFSSEIENLKKGLALPKPLQKLHPFIDHEGLVRVGGRLAHSELDYDCKHPLLLPRQHRLTSLIIDQCHTDNLHPGLRTLSFILAQNFWILSSRRAIRSRLAKCIRCYRTNPRPIMPRMADLPRLRVSQVKPFSVIGVDFAGPFPTHIIRSRGSKTFKTYVCLFICFATRAVHIELVIGLTTEAFLGALRRFIARRGRCQRIHCDQGTNFVGAFNCLLPLLQEAAATEAIEFWFNPPAAPHFGGLWEANIKSFKVHLTRVIGNQILTYEEFLTLATQIEAVLNSRPLCEMGSDPNDLSVLTPGHFLTLEPLSSIPESDTFNVKLTCLSRWQLVQRLHHDFWKRWHLEYLHTLTQRAKWLTDTSEPKLGSLVLIKDEQTKPLNWSLARIVELHRAKDGICRVATVKTQTGLLQRPLVKLCPLPIND